MGALIAITILGGVLQIVGLVVLGTSFLRDDGPDSGTMSISLPSRRRAGWGFGLLVAGVAAATVAAVWGLAVL